MSYERGTSARGFLRREKEHFWSRDGSSKEVALEIDRILTVDTCLYWQESEGWLWESARIQCDMDG